MEPENHWFVEEASLPQGASFFSGSHVGLWCIGSVGVHFRSDGFVLFGFGPSFGS